MTMVLQSPDGLSAPPQQNEMTQTQREKTTTTSADSNSKRKAERKTNKQKQKHRQQRQQTQHQSAQSLSNFLHCAAFWSSDEHPIGDMTPFLGFDPILAGTHRLSETAAVLLPSSSPGFMRASSWFLGQFDSNHSH